MREKPSRPENKSDAEIVSLFWQRSEFALQAVSAKYGRICTSIAANILGSTQDAEECVNDTWMKAWETIPPNRPDNLCAYLSKIAKNISLSRLRYSHAKKRGGGQMTSIMSELDECVPGKVNVEKNAEYKIMSSAVNEFLGSLPQEKRDLFVLRYWYCLSVKDISCKTGFTRNYVSVTLLRIRRSLQRFLTEKELL